VLALVSALLCVATVSLWATSFSRGIRIVPHSFTDQYDGFILIATNGSLFTGDHIDKEKFHSTHAVPILAITFLFALGPLTWLLARMRLAGEVVHGT
jgi:hypothetical protein